MCVNFLLGKSGEFVLSGTILDHDSRIQSRFVPVVAGTEIKINDEKGVTLWNYVTKYGFVGLNIAGKPFYKDALNSEGLSVSAQWMEETVYEKAEDYPHKKPIPYVYLIVFALGSCRNTLEVKELLNSHTFYLINVKGMGRKFPLHLIFHDREKRSLLVEFLNGKTHFHDFPVMTNNPPFEIQHKKLKEYQEFVSKDPALAGIRGIAKVLDDSYNDERFLMLCWLNEMVEESKSLKEAVANCFRILGRLDITYHENDMDYKNIGKVSNLWSTVTDHVNLKIYFRTYDNQQIRMIDVVKCLTERKRFINISSGDWYQEILP